MKTIAHSSQNPLQTSRTRRILLASIASLLAGHAGFAAEAIFSSGAITGDTGTSSTGAGATGSGVSGTKTYTAIANVIGADVLVNGATFVGSVDALSGVGWELTGLPNNFASGGNHTTTFGGNAGGAAIDQLFDGFQYGGDPGTLTLSGLTAGKTYVTTLYNEAWSWPSLDDRTNTFTSSQGVSTLYNPDALEASVLRYTFVATGATETLNFAQTRTNYSLHVYGLSNEQVFVNTWSPGGANNFTTATNWSGGVVPAAAAGSSASFSAQAGPTTVNLPANRTVGHIEIRGTGSYTLTHDPEDEPSIRLQADAGGVSVLNTETGGSHTIDVGVVLVSDAMKIGGGTLTLTKEVSGDKSLTVNGGTLRFGAVNSYSRGTTVGPGATLDLNGTSQLFNNGAIGGSGLSGGGTIVNNNSGTSVATVESGNFFGNILDHTTGTGLVALSKTSTGTLTLSGTNTYTGGTTVNAGTLRLLGNTSTALLTDNFLGANTPNTFDLNFNLANRQAGTTAPQSWTAGGNTQVGNPTVVQQPAGVGGNYLLLAFGASATLNGLSLSTTNAPGPLKISFDMFKGTVADATEWTSFTLRSSGGNGFPITGSGEFGFLYRKNTGVQVFNNNAAIQTIDSTTGGDSFGFYLADSAGTGSPFAGNGTRVVVVQGGSVLSSYLLDTGMAASTFLTFGVAGGIGGVDNLAISPVSIQTNVLNPATPVALNSAGAVLKLQEVDQTVSSLTGVAGTAVNMLPFSHLTVNSPTNTTFNGTITGPLAGFTKAGNSTLELGGASSYTGGTTIAGGTLLTHHPASLGSGPVSIAAGSNFLPWFNTVTPVIANDFTLNGLGGNPGDGNKSAIYADGGGAGYSEYLLTGKVTLAATSNISGHNTNNLRVLGQITGPGGLTKGSGRADENSALVLANTANDYAGDTVITNGTLRLGASDVIPDGAGKGKVIMSAGTTLDLAGNNDRINNLAGSGTVTSAPAVTIGAPVFFTTNVESGISLARTYTHRLDFGDGTPAQVNNVDFETAANSGANWTLAGATFLLPESAGTPSSPTFSDAANGTGMNLFLSDFYYNGNPATLTLNGLTPGTLYELRLYQRFWGGDRTQLFNFASGPATASFIHNQDGSNTPSYLSFRYSADASGVATLSTTQIGAGTFHWYGLTNEEVIAAALPPPVLTVGDATDSTYSGAITGNLEIDKVGTGTLTLSGLLNFDTLTASEGTVKIGNATLDALVIADGATVVITAAAAAPFAGAAQAVPEPGSIALLFGGMLTLLGRRRRSA